MIPLGPNPHITVNSGGNHQGGYWISKDAIEPAVWQNIGLHSEGDCTVA